jgi:hypothetical protein
VIDADTPGPWMSFLPPPLETAFPSCASSTFLRVSNQSANLSVLSIHYTSVINTQRAAIKMEEERSPTKSDYDSSYPVRPSMSRSSSVSSFLGRQGFDRYGDEWGGGALTLIGKLPLPSITIKLINRCGRDFLWSV